MKIRLPKTLRFRIYIYIAALLLVAFAVDLVWIRIDRHITLAPDTTVLTAPLDSAGRPDYARILDEQSSIGATLENNAAIPILHLTQPSFADFERTYVNARLRIPAPTSRDPQYRAFYQFLAQKTGQSNFPESKLDEPVDAAAAPWSPAEHPDVAQWLRAIDEPLDQLVAASTLPRYYYPILREPDRWLMDIHFPSLGVIRDACRALLARATLKLHDHNLPAAREDLLACHRIARLLAQSPFQIQYLVALAIDDAACRADRALALADLSADDLRPYLVQLDALPPFPPMTKCLRFERFCVLDFLVRSARDPLAGYLRTQQSDQELSPAIVWAVRLIPGNFNAALRDTNAYFDQLERTAAAATYRDMKAAQDAADQLARAQDQYFESAWSDPARRLAHSFMPYLASHVVFRNHTQRELTRLTLALALYRAEHHTFPPDLSALAPTCLLAVPNDPYSDLAFHYQPNPAGYLLYSVGPNLVDDGGQRSYIKKLDDIAVRYPNTPASAK